MMSERRAAADLHWMRHALSLARQALFRTSPNPRVGCVIVRDGQVLGEGATQPPGGPHAEVCALRDAAARGASVRGATVYVTLEPCSHHGRTPPCADALVAAAPARVVVAMGDPNPQVNGRGIARLRQAGIEVDTGVGLDEALEINLGFVARMARGTPWLWLKLAASLDGRSALHNGVSQWITGPAARADGHAWRARSCAVMTGIGTVLADDPRLDVREVETPRQPQRIVLDPRLDLPPSARLFETGGAVRVFTASEDAARARALEARGATVHVMPDGAGRVDLPAMLRWLAAHDVNEIHVEAGAGLSGALLQAGCVDALLVYLAPMLLGDAAGMVRLPALDDLGAASRFAFVETALVGGDARLRAVDAGRLAALRERVVLSPTR